LEDRQELVVLDFEGNHIQTTYPPYAECSFAFNGRYYYVDLNEDDEWELRVVNFDITPGEDVEK
jgi:hypothetical protein